MEYVNAQLKLLLWVQVLVPSKVETDIAGCLHDSRVILATMYINKGDKE